MTPREEKVSLALGALAMCVVGVFILFYMEAIESNNCHARWAQSSLEARYHWRRGCELHVDRYGWIPEANFNAARSEP